MDDSALEQSCVDEQEPTGGRGVRRAGMGELLLLAMMVGDESGSGQVGEGSKIRSCCCCQHTSASWWQKLLRVLLRAD